MSCIQNLSFFIVLFLVIITNSCEDDTINAVTPQLSKIESLFNPADAATEIQLLQAGNIVATAYLNKNGKYVFPNLEFGDYDIIVIAEGYRVTSEVNIIKRYKEVEIKNFELTPMTTSIRRVVANSEGTFIKNASITDSVFDNKFTTQTDQLGVFYLNQLPPEVELILKILAYGKAELQVKVRPIEKGGI